MPILACRSRERTLKQCLRQWWWRYLLIAFVDVEANYLVVKAYAYTTVTSVQVGKNPMYLICLNFFYNLRARMFTDSTFFGHFNCYSCLDSYTHCCLRGHVQNEFHHQSCHGQGKYLKNEIISRSEKRQGLLWMAREI